jgi:phospholipase C
MPRQIRGNFADNRCELAVNACRLPCLVAGAGLCLLGAGFSGSFAEDGGAYGTASPIEHLVVIFQENVSFDRYFATIRWR